MSSKHTKNMENYQLRYAAGQYWLLDMQQTGMPYKCPMSMNSMGAEIWRMLERGLSCEEIATDFSKEYDVAEEEMREDIIQFKKQLILYGVEIEE